MQNIVLVVHLILALCLIGVVLLQRSEGGALGMGGGGGGGLVSSRGAATALSKMTWALAVGFLCTSLALTVLAGGGAPGSVLDRVLGVERPAGATPTDDLLVLPPLPVPAAPVTPPAAD